MRGFTFYLQKSTSYQVEPKFYALNISADSDRYWPPKNDAIYNLFTNLLTILPIRRGIFASKKTPSHFTRDFAGIIMQTKFSPLHLYKSSFQRQVTTLTQKFFLLAYIKATVKAFWWGALLKFPHLIATKMAFWLGAFSKIQSMFTNSLSPMPKLFLKIRNEKDWK